jgi:hypothetical protein
MPDKGFIKTRSLASQRLERKLKMADFDNTNRGMLFINKRKEKSTHPDYNGRINVNGTEYWFSGWIKKSGPNAKNPGEQFVSVAVGDPVEGQNTAPATGFPGGDDVDPDEDVPF